MLRTPYPRGALFRLTACAASGACAPFCFEPYGLGFLAYFVFIPFILFSGVLDGSGRYLLNTYVFGFTYFMGSLYWIAMLDPEQISMPWLRLPAALVLSLYLALFVLLAGYFMRRMIWAGIPYQAAVPLAWAGFEYMRSLGPLGFPWSSIAYSQTPYAAVIQQCALTGTYGLSAYVVAVNAFLVWLALSRRRAALAALALLFCVPLIAGYAILANADYAEGAGAALIQPNVGAAVKWDGAFRDSTISILTEMSTEAAGSRIIVWPETAVPFYVRHQPSYMDWLRDLVRATDSYLLIGLPDFERSGGEIYFYNSALLLSPEGRYLGIYRKIHLVPFGEMIPFEDHIDFLKRVNFGEGDFTAGSEYTVLSLDGVPFGVAICFESIFPSLIREFAKRDARFIVNITNDAWFGPSLGPHQHAQMAVLRTVECRVGLIRCANTGISMVVDPYGRCVTRTDLFKRRTLQAAIPLGTGRTPYVRIGDLFGTAMLVLSVALGLAAGPIRRARP